MNLEENKEYRKSIEELKSRKRKLKNHGKSPFSWDNDTPMIKLIDMSQLHKFKKLFDIWQQFSDEKLETEWGQVTLYKAGQQIQGSTRMKTQVSRSAVLFTTPVCV